MKTIQELKSLAKRANKKIRHVIFAIRRFARKFSNVS